MTLNSTPRVQLRTLCARTAANIVLIVMLIGCFSSQAAAQWAENGSNINNTNTGNVGIGTSTPGGKLEVKSPASAHNSLILNTTTAGFADSLVFQEAGTAKASIQHNPGILSAGILFNTNGIASPTNTRMVINSAGNVGIGTTNPATRLELAPNTALKLGNAYFSSGGDYVHLANNEWHNGSAWVASGAGSLIQISGQDTNFYRHDAAGNHTQSMTIKSSGNVGIGTSTPTAKLDVRQNSGTFATFLTSHGANEDAYLRGGTSSAVIHIGDVTSMTSKVLLMENGGTVGIGTASPNASYKLDVNGNTKVIGNIEVTGTGNITAAGTINAKYQDVAEWVPSTHALPAGTVVTLDPTKSNHVEASSKSYDTRVAGVISAQPGIALGEKSNDKVLVATTGRVKIKVDASHGSIQIGD